MSVKCPYCQVSPEIPSEERRVIRSGSFRRKSDSKRIQRFSCLSCKKSFSRATFQSAYRQNKRRLNEPLRKLLCAGISLRGAARHFRISRTTVTRKVAFLSARAEQKLSEINLSKPQVKNIQLDDLITIEHTKLKPLSVSVVIEEGTRRILGLTVARIPASGKLAHLAKKKYGTRRDEARKERFILLGKLKPFIAKEATIKTDEWPQYPPVIKTHFPQATHLTYKGQRATIAGQGELKLRAFDPIFSVNHTLAMLRANINVLFRRSWCVTKKPERLLQRLLIYAVHHNLERILQNPKTPKPL